MKTVIYKMNDASPDIVHAIIENGNGTRVAKAIPFDVFTDIVTAATGDRERVRYIGALPSGFIDGGYSRDGKTMEAIIRLPGEVRSFLYNNEQYVIPVPTLIFMLKAREGSITRSFVCVEEKGRYYHYPFANVYPDGHICFGSLTFKGISTLKDLERVISAFVGANSNNDLYHALEVKTREGRIPMDQKQLLHFLSGKKRWPKEVKLIPFKDLPFSI